MALVSGPARIAVVGAGWRAGYALRVARERPDLVEITGVYARSARSAARIEDHWDVRVSTDLDVVIRDGSPEAAFVCVSKDAVEAYRWFNLAAAAAEDDNTRENATRNRDVLAKSMSREGVAKAQALAREWKPRAPAEAAAK